MPFQWYVVIQPARVLTFLINSSHEFTFFFLEFPIYNFQVAIEIPYTLAQVAIYGVVVYAMMGFEWTASKFFLNTFYMFITVLLFIYYGIVIVSVSPNQAAAAVVSGVFYTLWNLFSGFIIPRPVTLIPSSFLLNIFPGFDFFFFFLLFI